MKERRKHHMKRMNERRRSYRFQLPTRTADEHAFLGLLNRAAERSTQTRVEQFMAFPVWAPRQNVARFLAQWELFKLAREIHGSIIECGVAFGGGLMAWAHFLSIAEPVAHTRRVIGFDTFDGFPAITDRDRGTSHLAYKGGMKTPFEGELAMLAGLHDLNRAVGHIPRVELVSGDACKTIPQYVSKHPELIVSMLVLDFDIYEPTLAALEHLGPRMPRGGVVVFDELNCRDWPGETEAVRESGLLNRGVLKRCEFTSTMSYLVIE